MEIIPQEARPGQKANPQYFTGGVWVDPIVHTPWAPRLRMLRVSFEPGARTAWHTHPAGQVLSILSGTGWVQSDGQPVRTVRAGDTVVIAPGERHWHGASATQAMVHLAAQTADPAGNDVDWLESVTEAEYRNGKTA